MAIEHLSGGPERRLDIEGFSDAPTAPDNEASFDSFAPPPMRGIGDIPEPGTSVFTDNVTQVIPSDEALTPEEQVIDTLRNRMLSVQTPHDSTNRILARTKTIHVVDAAMRGKSTFSTLAQDIYGKVLSGDITTDQIYISAVVGRKVGVLESKAKQALGELKDAEMVTTVMT